jgi:hypothetical protein
MASDDRSTMQVPRKPACLACTQRKVKCDRTEPCQACRRTKLACNYPDVADPARRKRKVDSSTQSLLDTIRSYEERLRAAGLPSYDIALQDIGDKSDNRSDLAQERDTRRDLPSLQSTFGPQSGLTYPTANPLSYTMQSDTRDQPLTRGVLVPEYGGRRYYEHGLLGALTKEVSISPTCCKVG